MIRLNKKRVLWQAMCAMGLGVASCGAHAFVDPSQACKALVGQAARAGADPGYKCLAHASRKVVFAWLAPNAKKPLETSWASVKGFVQASAVGQPGGWDLIFEGPKSQCMTLSEADAKALAIKLGPKEGTLDSKEFYAEATPKLKPSACDGKQLARAELPAKGGKLCEALDAAAKPTGGLAAALVSCRQVGDVAHIETRKITSFVNFPRSYFALYAAAGKASASVAPQSRINMPLDNERNPTRCMSVPFGAFAPIAKLSEKDSVLAGNVPDGKRLTDLAPGPLVAGVLAPLTRMQLEPELGGSVPCLGYSAMELVYSQVLGRAIPPKK